MIKTVSFAPPRASGSRQSAKASKAKPASLLTAESPRAASEIDSEVSKKESAPAQAAPLKNGVSGGSPSALRAKKTGAKSGSELSLNLFSDGFDEAGSASIPAPRKTEKPRVKAENSAKTATEKVVPEAEIAAPGIAVQVPQSVAAVKAKKVRVPKDLAAQYGEKTAIRPAVPLALEVEAPKKRLNKTERQARRDLMKPSESLMERLARANQITARKPASEPRGKGWKFQCGRCGATSYFQTPGGLCACGTIAIKE